MENTRRTTVSRHLLRMGGYLAAWRRYREVVNADTCSAAELADRQESKLARLLRHAAANVPYYADLISNRGLDIDHDRPHDILRQLPTLTKQEIAANFPDRILSRGRRGLASEHLTSTGTTADRIDIVVGPSAQLSRLALVLWRHRLGGRCPVGTRRLEIPPDACSRICAANTDRPNDTLSEIRWAATHGDSVIGATLGTINRRLRTTIRHGLIYDDTLPPFGPAGTSVQPEFLQTYIDAINEEKPYLLAGLPTYLHQLARHLQRSGQRVHVPVVHPMGALSTPRQRQMIAEAFNAKVFDTYGSSELGTFSAQCDERQRLHVAMTSYVVEILKGGRPAAEGELGHIVVTALDNHNMPLIRYKVGDVGRWWPGPCDCGRQSKLIECNGRIQDLVVTSQGNPVTEEEVLELAYFELGLEQVQLVERSLGEFDVMAVPAPGHQIDTRAVTAAFTELLDRPRRLQVFPVETIYPEETGKFRFVKSKSYERFD